MDQTGAEKAITTSALVVIGVYAYRRFTEPSTASGASVKSLAGVGPPPTLGVFATGWTFVFLACSIMAEIDPGLGGGFAVLIATSDFLTNGQQIFTDVSSAEVTATTPVKATSGNTSTKATPLQSSVGAGVAGAGADAVTSALMTGLV